METLYLIETRAQRDYACPGCGEAIRRGSSHFRHDPHPAARQFRGKKTSHWCRECILNSDPGPKEFVTRRIRVPAVRVLREASDGALRQADLFDSVPLRVELLGVTRPLIEVLTRNPELIHSLAPTQFEEFVSDRLYAMGLEPHRTGPINRKDGGIDVIFWPRQQIPFPFLGAVQIKHHRNPQTGEGPSTVRDFAGAIAGQPFNAGIIVTNSSFSPDARWFAKERAKLLRLREFEDLRRWLANNFTDDAEWREIPSTIELCPGIVINLPRPGNLQPPA